MKKLNTVLIGTVALSLGLATSQAQIASTASNAVTGATNLAKGAANSTISGLKGLASLPGKSLSLSDNFLPNLSAGTQEFGVSGNIGFQDEFSYNLDLSYGYFFKDNWEVGFNANLAGIEETFALGVGLFTEYNFDIDSKWVPFIGGSIGLASVSLEEIDTVSTLDIAGVFGVKYFVRENIAISGSVDFSWTPSDALDAEVGGDVNIGTRFYF